MASALKRGNSYQIRVSVGRDSTGKYAYEVTTWTPPAGLTAKKEKAALEAAIQDFERRVKSGRYLSGEKTTLLEFANTQWLPYAKSNLKPKTFADYCEFLEKRILPVFGRLPLAQIQPIQIINWLRDLDQKGMRNTARYRLKPHVLHLLKTNNITAEILDISSNTNTRLRSGHVISFEIASRVSSVLNSPIDEIFETLGTDDRLSDNTKGNYFRCLSSVLSTAVQWQMIIENPCKRVKAPSQRGHEISHMNIDEAQKAYQAALNYHDIRVGTAIITLLQTGIREGELAGLEWKDIDFDKSEIHIQRNSQYIRRIGIVTGTTKTRSGNRAIAIAPDLIELLEKYRNWQNAEKARLGDLWQNTDRLYTQWDGSPIHNQTITKWNKKFMADSGFKYTTVHGLRHSFATLQIAAGTDLRTVSQLLGHADVSTTMNIYAHSLKTSETAAAGKISKILRGEVR